MSDSTREHPIRVKPPLVQDQLRHIEQRFRHLVENVKDYAIFMLDPGGHVVTWSAGAQSIKGYSAAEILGQHFSRFYPPEVVARGWPQHELDVARLEGRFEDEAWRVRKDGSLFWANVIITALYDDTGTLYGFAKVTRDLTQRNRLETLERTARRMTEFLAMLSHELRNPLASIRNAITVMETRTLDDPHVDWARNVIGRQTSHLARIVDDLLDVSRIASGKVALHKAPLDIVGVVSQALEFFGPMLIKERGLLLDVSQPDEPLWVLGDATRLTQVVTNLLHNAVKYTPEGGRIHVAVRRETGRALISVRDTGIGIGTHLLGQIFELFVQGERGQTRGGLGVGLALAKQLVEMHDGTIGAHSDGPGQGSEFVIRLPMLDAAAARGKAAASAPSCAAGAAASRRVLVVDDNHDVADSTAMLLAYWGYKAIGAYDGPSALAAAAEFQPEIVLLDLDLPGMSGEEVCRRLRENAGQRRTVTVAVTGHGQPKDFRRSRQCGCEYHEVKPVDPDRLKTLLATIVADHLRRVEAAPPDRPSSVA